MTDMEKEQLEIYRLANEKGKFAVPVAQGGTDMTRESLEDLMLRRLIVLIDVAFIRPAEDIESVMLARIFMLSDEAKAILARANAN